MGVSSRISVLLIAVSFLGISTAHSQAKTSDPVGYQDRTLVLVKLACDPNSPTELQLFTRSQIEHRISYLKQAIPAIKANAVVYTPDDKKELDSKAATRRA
jgi:hypothetical protein